MLINVANDRCSIPIKRETLINKLDNLFFTECLQLTGLYLGTEENPKPPGPPPEPPGPPAKPADDPVVPPDTPSPEPIEEPPESPDYPSPEPIDDPLDKPEPQLG